MKYYYYNSPRGFGNEFSIISVDQENPKEVQAFAEFEKSYRDSNNFNWDLHRVTRKRAFEIVANERATKRMYLSAGMNLHCNPVGATEITTASEYFDL